MQQNLANMPSNQKFGWLFASIFGIGSGYFQLKHSPGWAMLLVFLAALFSLVTIYVPKVLTPLNRAWFALSLFLGKFISPIGLSIIFFVVIAPVAIITRLFGRDALLLKKRQVPSYWVYKESIEPESFKNQF